MKVYALFSGEYSGTIFHGVYSSREAAQAQVDRAECEGFTSYYELGGADPYIIEAELDNEAYQFWRSREVDRFWNQEQLTSAVKEQPK